MGRVAEVIITSGIPGAGKSTWIRRNTNPWMTEVFSADDYFINETGRYNFQPEKLSEAHCSCLRRLVSNETQTRIGKLVSSFRGRMSFRKSSCPSEAKKAAFLDNLSSFSSESVDLASCSTAMPSGDPSPLDWHTLVWSGWSG